MGSITTVVHFAVPAGNVDLFCAFWQDHIKDAVSKQPGLIDGIFYRGTDLDGPFQFINVARWESAEQLASGLKVTGEEMPEIGRVFQELGVKVSQNNYVEAKQYSASPDPAQPE